MVRGIFLLSLSNLTVFFYNVNRVFLGLPLGITPSIHSIIYAFSPNHSRLVLKYARIPSQYTLMHHCNHIIYS